MLIKMGQLSICENIVYVLYYTCKKYREFGLFAALQKMKCEFSEFSVLKSGL